MRRKICVVTLFLVFIGQIVMAGGNTADFKYGKWHLKYTLSTGNTYIKVKRCSIKWVRVFQERILNMRLDRKK